MACCNISFLTSLFPFLSEYSRAKELLCVPVDVTDTLRCFRETLEKSKYHNRSIRHSRKLLSLFLAQTQGEIQSLVSPMHLREWVLGPPVDTKLRGGTCPLQSAPPCLVSTALHLQKQRADCACSVFLSLYFYRVPPCGSTLFCSRFLLPPLACPLSAAFHFFLLVQWITFLFPTLDSNQSTASLICLYAF